MPLLQRLIIIAPMLAFTLWLFTKPQNDWIILAVFGVAVSFVFALHRHYREMQRR